MTTTPIVLIVEDDEVQAAVFTRALKDAGYEVEHIADGQDALDHLATAQPDLILLDLHLPRVDGQQILSFIHAQDHLKDTQVIVASADGAMADQLPDKPLLVLNKPVSVFQLQHLATRLHPTNHWSE